MSALAATTEIESDEGFHAIQVPVCRCILQHESGDER